MASLIVDGNEVSYSESGSGPTLVLVHGQLCDYRYWEPQRATLAKSYRVVAVSLRHFWPGHCDESSRTFTSDVHASDVGAFIAALDVGPVHLCGHSRGGYVTLRVAQRFPQLLRTLTLAEPAGPVADPERAEPPTSAAFEAALPQVLARLRAGDVDGGLTLFVDVVAGDGAWSRSAPAFKRMARDNAMTLLAQAKFEPVRAPIAYADVQSIAVPVLLIGGERTPAPYPQTLTTLERALPDVRRVLIPRAGHAMNVENAPAFNRELLQFLDENREI